MDEKQQEWMGVPIPELDALQALMSLVEGAHCPSCAAMEIKDFIASEVERAAEVLNAG